MTRAETSQPPAPVALECENAVDPFIDTREPRLSWKLDDPREGAAQSAYRVLVASSEEKLAADQSDLWDSGKVASDQSILVSYAGKPLQSGQRVSWKVKIWDQDGKESPWSAPASWEMALLDPANEFGGSWIRTPESALLEEQRESGMYEPDPGLGEWLCGEGIVRTHFRKTFELDVDPASLANAELLLQSDNRTDVFINGKPVLMETEGFRERGIYRIPVQKFLRPGKNVIAVRFFMSANPEWIFSSFRAGLVLEKTDGEIIRIATDESWREGPLAFRGPKGPERFTRNEDWTALDYDDSDFIEPTYHDAIHPVIRRRSAQFRKTFVVEPGARTDDARLYITAKGLYEAWINGKRVGDAVLMPGRSEMNTLYQVYDISDLLKVGENQIEIRTASGWHAEPNHWNGWKFIRQHLIARLVWEGNERGATGIATDESWDACLSPVLQDSRYFGERYDARVEEKMDEPDYWTEAETAESPDDRPFTLYAAEPTRVVETAEPESITKTEEGWLFDFGRQFTGRPVLRLRNQPEGQTVSLTYAEALDEDGTLNDDPYGVFPLYPNAKELAPGIRKGMDAYIPAGRKEEVYAPSFTMTGYRYVLVKGLTEAPDKNTLTARLFSHGAPQIGRFECSAPLVNRIVAMAERTMDCNLIEHHNDCMSREQGAWLADAMTAAELGGYHRDLSRFYRKWFNNGPFIPSLDGDINHRAGWFDGYLRIPQLTCAFYGDERIIEESLGRMRKLVDDRIERLNAIGFGGIEDRENGDHLAYQYVNNRLFRSLWWLWSFRTLAENLERAGHSSEAAKYRDAYETWLPRFQETFYAGDEIGYFYPDEGDRVINGHAAELQAAFDRSLSAQTPQVLALELGLVPEDKTDAVVEVLVRNIERDGGLQTGIHGTRALFKVLADHGQADLAMSLMLSREFPSWGYMAEKGISTIAESFEADGVLSHPTLGGGVSWVYSHLAGIQPAKPGFKEIRLAPVFPEGLDWVKASYECPYGTIRSDWNKEGDAVAWSVTVPPNTTAVAEAPQGYQFENTSALRELASGTYELTLKENK